MGELLNTKSRNGYSARLLVILCVVLYTITTAGKKIFNSNINELMRYFGQDKTAIGIVTTCFFVACAVGQVIHGVLCSRYNIKYVIFGVLVITGTLYGCIPLIPVNAFWIVKYLWIVNGLVEAALWACILYLLNTSIANKHTSFAFALLTIPTPLGSCLSLGIGSLFSFIGNFKWSFYLVFIMYAVVAAVWLCCMGGLRRSSLCEKELLDPPSATEAKDASAPKKIGKLPAVFLVTFIAVAALSIAEQVCYEGLMSWLPTILSDEYGLENWFGVLLTVLLPVVAYLGNILGKILQAKMKNYLLAMGVFFGAAAMFCGVTLVCFRLNVWAITLVCATLCSCAVAGANMIETVIFPMENSQYLNSGFMGGVICACNYAGCAISGYGLGGIADNGSWFAAFGLMFGLMAGAAVLAICLGAFCKIKKGKGKAESGNDNE